MRTQTNDRNPVRQAYGSYQLPIKRRAVVAAGMVKQNGWTQKQAAGLLCVNPGYVGLVGRLNDEDLLKLSRRELKLSRLWKDYRRGLAERRTKRLAVEREAQVRAERKAQVRAVDTVLETVSFDRVVERIMAHFGPEPLLEELDILLQRNGRDLSQLILRVCDRERVMRVFDAVTAPQAVAAE
jgi:hypothetical protein